MVESVDVAEADHPGGHVVGEDDDVDPDRVTGGELGLIAAEPVLVRVDPLHVVDLDPGLFREAQQGGRVAVVVEVDVLDPVVHHQDRASPASSGGSGCTATAIASAGSEQRRAADQEHAPGTHSLEKLPTIDSSGSEHRQ